MHLESTWKGSLPEAVDFWKERFAASVAPLYALPGVVRSVVYTINAVSALTSTLRKVVHKRSTYTGDTILSCMFLCSQALQKNNWQRRALRNWQLIRGELLTMEQTRELCTEYMTGKEHSQG